MSEDKPYYIKLENRSNYLYALVGGKELSPQIAKMYWDEIAAKYNELNVRKILIEKDFSRSVTPAEMLEMANYLGKILAGAKIAFIDRYDNEYINELGKVLARNEGVMMRIFEDIKDAERWLIGTGNLTY